MNEQEKMKANMAAAKLLGKDENYALHSSTTGAVMLVSLDGPRHWVGTFSIFTSPADCLDVIRKLLLSYNVDFKGMSGNKSYWFEIRNQDCFVISDVYATLEQAVAAAVLEVTK